ncbi:uncharacterized protein [Henckelia pumila]|uniref:uncharacterized protein n=1 Tax=Henckelia pumila TaxID=405737 RepID=UPI003C6DC393
MILLLKSRSQVLLLDPMPPINKVFALVVQEERQRAIGHQSYTAPPNNGMAFAIKNDSARSQQKFPKGRPYCTSCHGPGHTKDTCYKLHGYPPGYKHKNKNSAKSSPAPVNQISESFPSTETPVNSTILQHIDKSQMEQLMNMFVQHLSTYDRKNVSQAHIGDNSVEGPHQEDDWQG